MVEIQATRPAASGRKRKGVVRFVRGRIRVISQTVILAVMTVSFYTVTLKWSSPYLDHRLDETSRVSRLGHVETNRPQEVVSRIDSSLRKGKQLKVTRDGVLGLAVPPTTAANGEKAQTTSEGCVGRGCSGGSGKAKEKLVADILALEKDYHGPSGSLSTIDAVGIGGMLQAEDPSGRGRRPPCMEEYFNIWRGEDPFSGEPFFEWLNHGSGKKGIKTRRCGGKNKIRLFGKAQRKRSAVRVDVLDDGAMVRLVFAETNKPAKKGIYDYVWGTDKNIYMGMTRWDVSHVSFLRGKPVLMAGEIEVESDGRLVSINQLSGHYRPMRSHLQAFYRFFKAMGVNYDAVAWKRSRNHQYTEERLEEEWIDDGEAWVDDDAQGRNDNEGEDNTTDGR